MATNREILNLWGLCERWLKAKEQWQDSSADTDYQSIMEAEQRLANYIRYIKKKREEQALRTEPIY